MGGWLLYSLHGKERASISSEEIPLTLLLFLLLFLFLLVLSFLSSLESAFAYSLLVCEPSVTSTAKRHPTGSNISMNTTTTTIALQL